LENAGFSSGSALALLHVALHDPNTAVPTELLTGRLALRAAVNCLKLQGRAATEGEIRDAYLLTQAGDQMGPSGDMLAFWLRGIDISLKSANWTDRLYALLSEEMQETVADLLNAHHLREKQCPASAAATVLASLIDQYRHEEAVALLVTDIVLSRELSWAKPIPLLATMLKRSAIRSLLNDHDEEAFRLACHTAIATAAHEAVRAAHDLARRAVRLRQIVPKLRAKGSDDAVALFLSEDAIFPTTMLSPVIKGTRTKMSDHAARRLCDRLVSLGVVKELTGRPTFRLYGVA